MSVHEATQIAIAALGQGVTPIVRCCRDALFEGTRALDNGAMGVVVPHVDTVEDARAVAAAYRFPPAGTRSWGGPPFAYGFQPPPTAEAQVELNRDILVACMIETPEAVANAPAIAAVEGIDVLWIGHFDLTASLGIPGQFQHPDYLRSVDRVLEACHRHGRTPGIMAADAESAHALLRQGFRAVAYSGDLWIYGRALKQGIDGIRHGMESPNNG